MLIIFLFLLFVPTSLAAQEPKKQPSLAELARKGREQKKDSSKKAITNADLKRFRRARITTSGTRLPSVSPEITPSEAKSKSSATESEEGEGKDHEFWKSAFSEAQLNVRNVVNRGLVLQLKMNNLRNAFFTEDDGSTQALIQSQLNQTLQEIEQNKSEATKARKALATLEREARRAGMPARVIQELTKDSTQATEIAPL